MQTRRECLVGLIAATTAGASLAVVDSRPPVPKCQVELPRVWWREDAGWLRLCMDSHDGSSEFDTIGTLWKMSDRWIFGYGLIGHHTFHAAAEEQAKKVAVQLTKRWFADRLESLKQLPT